jgi:hypothetical protein
VLPDIKLNYAGAWNINDPYPLVTQSDIDQYDKILTYILTRQDKMKEEQQSSPRQIRSISPNMFLKVFW